MHVYRQQSNSGVMPQYIWALQDHHQVLPQLSKHQQTELIKRLIQRPLSDMVIITEDRYDAPSDKVHLRSIADRFFPPCDDSILCGLSHKLRAAGYEVANAEHRFVHSISIQYLIEYHKERASETLRYDECQNTFITYGLTVDAFAREAEEIFNDLSCNLASTSVWPYAHEVLTQFDTAMLRLFPNGIEHLPPKCTLLEYYVRLTNEEQMLFCEHLEEVRTIDVILVNLTALAFLHRYSDKQHALVCMGGEHINDILKVLSCCGYEQLFSYHVNPLLTEFKNIDDKDGCEQEAWRTKTYVRPLDSTHFDLIGSHIIV
jgi:hypothetical protein